jgi:hypothetical protein
MTKNSAELWPIKFVNHSVESTHAIYHMDSSNPGLSIPDSDTEVAAKGIAHSYQTEGVRTHANTGHCGSTTRSIRLCVSSDGAGGTRSAAGGDQAQRAGEGILCLCLSFSGFKTSDGKNKYDV